MDEQEFSVLISRCWSTIVYCHPLPSFNVPSRLLSKYLQSCLKLSMLAQQKGFKVGISVGIEIGEVLEIVGSGNSCATFLSLMNSCIHAKERGTSPEDPVEGGSTKQWRHKSRRND